MTGSWILVTRLRTTPDVIHDRNFRFVGKAVLFGGGG